MYSRTVGSVTMAKAGTTRRRGRIILPAVLVLAAAAGLVYGFAWHTVTVEPKAEPPPAEEAAPPTGVPPEILPDADPIFSPDVLFGGGPADVPDLTVKPEPPPQPNLFREGRIVKEVTIGGLERLPSGAIALTYGPNEEAPTTCPT